MLSRWVCSSWMLSCLRGGGGKLYRSPPFYRSFFFIFFFLNESRAICRSSLKANSDEVGESNVQSFLLSKLEKSINKCNVSDLGPQAQSGVLFLYFLTHRTWQPSPLLSGVAGKGGRETCEPPGQRTAALRSLRVKVGELRRRRRKKNGAGLCGTQCVPDGGMKKRRFKFRIF